MFIRQNHSARISRSSLTLIWWGLICAIGLPIAAPVLAKAESTRFDIAAQPLSAALQAFATQARMQLLYEHVVVENAIGNAVSGEFDKHAALEQLLRGTGLEVVYSSDNAAVLRLAHADANKDITKEQKTISIEKDIAPMPFGSFSTREK